MKKPSESPYNPDTQGKGRGEKAVEKNTTRPKENWPPGNPVDQIRGDTRKKVPGK